MQDRLLELADVARPRGGRPPGTWRRPRHGPRPAPAAGTRSVSAVSCGLVDAGGIVQHGRDALLRPRRGRSARPPAAGESGSPKTSIVRCRPAWLTTFPSGLSRRRSSAIAARISSRRLSMRRMFSVGSWSWQLSCLPDRQSELYCVRQCE